jgi:hypothetical protein
MVNLNKPFSGDCGEFFLKETGKYFTFRPTNNQWALEHGLTHEIDVLDGIRFGIVKKTAAYVAVDEAADGSPVGQSWCISRRKNYAV